MQYMRIFMYRPDSSYEIAKLYEDWTLFCGERCRNFKMFYEDTFDEMSVPRFFVCMLEHIIYVFEAEVRLKSNMTRDLKHCLYSKYRDLYESNISS